ncbi:phosphoenolpyruvate carboxylase [Vulgatibacter incomptus]|uniref:phosphoenolpyruvate carboxylase n=1 Tax=Vulgatibacter incomptus TaxID=1391653 RepID=UPI0023E404D5|nr:phosphoenolpyruvate carboxylase [Vulgatibacter incomptus]
MLLQARRGGVTAADARAAIASLQVTLTLTAHPTQASRHTVLEKLDRIADELEDRDRCALLPDEEAASWERIREEVTALWQTDEVRRERPTVGDEVKNVLWYAEGVLWKLLPALPEALAHAFERAYGEPLGMEPSPLRLHSWVGGDMDGNPMVTPDVVEDAIAVHQGRALRLLLEGVRRLGSSLSQSTRYVDPPEALLASIASDAAAMPGVAERLRPRTEGEPWRRKLRFMEARLEASLARVEARRSSGERTQASHSIVLGASGIAPAPIAPAGDGAFAHAYRRSEELEADLEVIASSLAACQGANAGERRVKRLLAQARAVGFHLLELELRALSSDVKDAAAWLRGTGGRTDAAERFLSALWKVAAAQESAGERSCRTLILSMTHGAKDLLEALYCAKESGLWDPTRECARLDIVPLFETLDALDAAPGILRELFANPVYRHHVACRGQQEVMIGYSDSGKEVGLLAAAAALYRAQGALPAVAAEAQIPLRVFHGRGESVARGGGPAQQAILALPPGSVGGRYKATEQGEALDHKYARPQLAMRTLELIVGGALLHTLGAQERPSPDDERRYVEAFEELAAEGRRCYRALVYDEPRFVEFFHAATPIEEIARLPIGSRPSKRSAGGLEALRAIPWVFSWTQNRSILPGWYGVGSALEAFGRRPGGLELLREMYAGWPYFRTVVGNVEMVLAKSDLAIAERYAALATAEARAAVWPKIDAEHRRTRRWVKRITESERILDGNPPLQRSIALRNPYVDPMSFLQVELLRRKREGMEGCQRPLLLTIDGIAAGLRNTG